MKPEKEPSGEGNTSYPELPPVSQRWEYRKEIDGQLDLAYAIACVEAQSLGNTEISFIVPF